MPYLDRQPPNLKLFKDRICGCETLQFRFALVWVEKPGFGSGFKNRANRSK